MTDPSVSDEDLWCRARTWYSLYSLEVLISGITGRPKSISVSDVSIPIDLLERGNPDDSPESSVPLRVGDSILLEISRKAWLEHLNLMQNTSSREVTVGERWQEAAAPDHAVPNAYLPQ